MSGRLRASSTVMLSEALQRNAKHEARLSNISVYFCCHSFVNHQRFFSRECGIRMTPNIKM